MFETQVCEAASSAVLHRTARVPRHAPLASEPLSCDFCSFFGQLKLRSESHNVWTIVVEEVASGELSACGSIFIELKFTHECGKVGHIEDIVVSR
jgi:hypothetical protein